MIISCEKCSTRFKVADDKITPDGVKVRCSKCSHVFTVKADGAASPADSPPGGIFSPPKPSGDPFAAAPTVPKVSGPAGDPGFDPFKAPPPPADDMQQTAVKPMFPAGNGPSADPFAAAPSAPPDPTEVSALPSGADPFAGAPEPSPAPDPFAAPAGAPSSGDPFSAPPAGAPSSRVASPPGGDPFAAPAASPTAGVADPFASAQPPPPTSEPPADDPFGPSQADPFAKPTDDAGGNGSPPSAADMFAGLGVEAPDEYAPSFDAPDAVRPAEVAGGEEKKGDGVYGYQAETRVHEVDKELLEKTADKPKTPSRGMEIGSRVGRAVSRAVWVAVQAGLLISFLTVAIVYARGGNVDDVVEGRAADVLLGRVATTADVDAPLRAEDIVVARRPIGLEPGLIAISGVVANDGPADAPAVRVKVTLGDAEFLGWAGTEVTGLQLEAVATAEDLVGLLALTPTHAAVPVAERRPFVVLAHGVDDGARAEIAVEVAEPPPPPPPKEVAVDVEGEGDAAADDATDKATRPTAPAATGAKGGVLRTKKEASAKPGRAPAGSTASTGG